MAAQEALFGSPCPVLACAVKNRIGYCLRDCNRFPCEVFKETGYPFSGAFLGMQERRRREDEKVRTPSGSRVEVPPEYWTELRDKNQKIVCENAGAEPHLPQGLLLPFLGEYLLVDPGKKRLFKQIHGQWEWLQHPLLELVTLLYLIHATPSRPRNDLVHAHQLRCGHFFKGPHELPVAPLIDCFGHDGEAFSKAAEFLEGRPEDLADRAFRFQVFPKIPVFVLLWEGDEEFPPRVSMLFDRSIEIHLAADAIWGLANILTETLVHGRP
jgi:hypothetical protein